VLNEETADKYVITMGQDVLAVNKADVKSATPPISAMPPMTGLLTLRETRDIVAYLATLDKPIKTKGKKPTPKPYVATK
jgi:quinoprotein glucose dehydrogenase